MKQQRTNKVTVIGAVNAPGPHELPRGSSSVLAALVAAGGLSKEAGVNVEIRRTAIPRPLAGGPNCAGAGRGSAAGNRATGRLCSTIECAAPSIKVNLAQAAAGATMLPPVEDGDVVYVAKRLFPPVHVQGLVQKPGEFAFPVQQDLRLLDALALAGGWSNPMADKVLVIRQFPGQPSPAYIAASIHHAMDGQDNLLLAPGDMVIVERTVGTAFVDMVNTILHVGVGVSAGPTF